MLSLTNSQISLTDGMIMNELRKYDLIRKRKFICDFCKEYQGFDLQLHHCLIPKNYHRQKTSIKKCEDEKNLAVLCDTCHENKTGKAFRDHFWVLQCGRYGTENMKKWYKSIPLLEKPIYFEEE